MGVSGVTVAVTRYSPKCMNMRDAATAAFGDLPPVGYLLRTGLPSRWLRIHSLPGSKRYAETSSEYDELLQRHNEVADEVLEASTLVFFHSLGDAVDFRKELGRLSWTADFDLIRTAPMMFVDPSPDEDQYLVAGFPIRWLKHGWDQLIRDVADDRMSSVVFLNPSSGEAYAPYDGGADLILASPGRVTSLAARWSLWRSDRADGL